MYLHDPCTHDRPLRVIITGPFLNALCTDKLFVPHRHHVLLEYTGYNVNNRHMHKTCLKSELKQVVCLNKYILSKDKTLL